MKLLFDVDARAGEQLVILAEPSSPTRQAPATLTPAGQTQYCPRPRGEARPAFQQGASMSFTSEFKEFAMKGNVVDLAVGVIIGGAFGKIVDSIVGDLIMPLVGKVLGGLDFSNYFIALSGQTATNLADAKKAGAVFAYGSFITVAINFVILAFIIFMMVKQINRLKNQAPPPAPAAPPEDTVLLREIRDSLKR
jgi:large conductance mechanosensitive channel